MKHSEGFLRGPADGGRRKVLALAGTLALAALIPNQFAHESLEGREQDRPAATPAGQRLVERIPRELLEKAAARGSTGSVRVIVTFDARLEPEDRSGATGNVERRREKIDVAREGLLSYLGAAGDRRIKTFKYTPHVALEVTETELRRLAESPLVLRVQEDKPVPPDLASTIPLIRADVAATNGFTGQGQIVAILDTGIDTNHEFLNGRTVAEACFSTVAPRTGAPPCPQSPWSVANPSTVKSSFVLFWRTIWTFRVASDMAIPLETLSAIRH